MKALSPKEAKAQKVLQIPEPIIQAANELLVRNLSLAGIATFKLKDLKTRAYELAETDTEFVDTDFDIEPLFENEGWKVEFDRPGYNENNEAFFRFTAPRS